MMTRRFRKSRLAGVAFLALVGVGASKPAQAADIGDLLEFFEEIFDYGDVPDSFLGMFINEILRYFGQSENSYLPDGADFGTMFPDMAQAVTIGDAKAVMDKRNKDRQARAEEVMAVPASITRQMPFENMQLQALLAANRNPYSYVAVLQIANELSAMNFGQLTDALSIMAENTQLEIDRAVQEEYSSKQAYQWAKYHYRNAGYWQGDRRFTYEVLDY